MHFFLVVFLGVKDDIYLCTNISLACNLSSLENETRADNYICVFKDCYAKVLCTFLCSLLRDMQRVPNGFRDSVHVEIKRDIHFLVLLMHFLLAIGDTILTGLWKK